MTDNRRNYYRILQVQPDASLGVITSNYRTLLQKLRLHPDLGGESRNASLINRAYATLRCPTKRAIYHRQVLRQHGLAKLSRGHRSRIPIAPKARHNNASSDQHGNRRDYYRILHIQPDASDCIVRSSYRTLLNKSTTTTGLLDEAFRVLSAPNIRMRYDHFLKQYSHVDIVDLMHGHATNNDPPKKLNTELMLNRTSRKIFKSTNSYAFHSNTPSPRRNLGYTSSISHYCAFCKTPYEHSPCTHSSLLCTECESPLLPPPKMLAEQSRRILSRLSQRSPVLFYPYWPGAAHTASLCNISPTGLCFAISQKLNRGHIIKIDGQDFKAVGEVTYSRNEEDQITAGVRFLTVQFDKQKGHFLSVKT